MTARESCPGPEESLLLLLSRWSEPPVSLSGTGLPRLRGTYTPVCRLLPPRAFDGHRCLCPEPGQQSERWQGCAGEVAWGQFLRRAHPHLWVFVRLWVDPQALSLGRYRPSFPLCLPLTTLSPVSPSRCSSCRSSVSHEQPLPSAAAASCACVSEPSAAPRQPAAASTSELRRGSGALLAAAPLSSEGELRSVQ